MALPGLFADLGGGGTGLGTGLPLADRPELE